jgi:hypothetical protein
MTDTRELEVLLGRYRTPGIEFYPLTPFPPRPEARSAIQAIGAGVEVDCVSGLGQA